MNLINNGALFAKGTCLVEVKDPVSGDLMLRSDLVNTNNLQTTCDLDPIRSGLGNALAIQIPSNSAVTLDMDLAELEMQAKAMQVGAKLAYNQVTRKCVVIEAAENQITLPEAPSPQVGFTTPYVYVQQVGASTFNPQAYTVNSSNQVQGFEAVNGTSYAVTYYIPNPSAMGFTVSSNFAPGIYHVTAQIAVYSNANTSANSQSSLVGWLYYVIPRMQFSGKADIDGGQSSNVVTSLAGNALRYTSDSFGVCTDCATSMLAQVYYVPSDSSTSAVQALVIPGGVVTVQQGGTVQTPVLYLMPDGSTVQPNYGDLTYQIASGGSSYASVNDTGVISGTAEGDTEITVSLASPALSVVGNVTVTAAG